LVIGSRQSDRDPTRTRESADSRSGGAAQRLGGGTAVLGHRSETDGGDDRGGDRAQRGKLGHLADGARRSQERERLREATFECDGDALGAGRE
jgi:hypothetical protein